MIKYQYTFYNSENKYKPITVTLIPRPHEKIDTSLKRRAVLKACAERGWTWDEMLYKYKYDSFRRRMIKEDK